MSNFQDRTNYFKTIATKNKLVAHSAVIAEGQTRFSFHRINDEAELNSACVNWAHFPCMVHIGNNINYRQNGTGLPMKMIGNHLYFLTTLDSTTHPFKSDAIQAAYEDAEKVMDQAIAYMIEDVAENGTCGNNLFMFDMNRAKADMIGPINEVLYGWYLVFIDEAPGYTFKYNANDWNI
ncbi:MAG: hypothetical protein M0Q26_05910 [Chitinophagaceae bacterium]|nr:hypothetical protein [Chitinophagaceae bacterium]MDP1763418.1 hypothetical protein [Sediminibacterium sp.]